MLAKPRVFTENLHLVEFSPIIKVSFQLTKREDFYTLLTGASPLGGAGRTPVPLPVILQLQGDPVFSGKIYFTNSAYSLSIIII